MMEAYRLRVALLNAGYCPIPCRDGKPISGAAATSESGIRYWINGQPSALETAVLIGGSLVVVTEAPKTPAELRAQQITERELRQRKANQARKEGRRRALGALPRAEWLRANSISRDKPWLGLKISRKTWYRRGKPSPSCDTGPAR